ncbi:MAG: Ferric iron ABC transporter, iron-binding protein, partial [uncultured Frankineae bacterium]
AFLRRSTGRRRGRRDPRPRCVRRLADRHQRRRQGRAGRCLRDEQGRRDLRAHQRAHRPGAHGRAREVRRGGGRAVGLHLQHRHRRRRRRLRGRVRTRRQRLPRQLRVGAPAPAAGAEGGVLRQRRPGDQRPRAQRRAEGGLPLAVRERAARQGASRGTGRGLDGHPLQHLRRGVEHRPRQARSGAHVDRGARRPEVEGQAVHGGRRRGLVHRPGDPLRRAGQDGGGGGRRLPADRRQLQDGQGPHRAGRAALRRAVRRGAV